MPLKPVRQKRLYQQIAEQIYDLIASGEIERGTRLPGENGLARDLGVSRPSVREALIVLETAGIIEVVNGAGSYVRPDAAIVRHLPWTHIDDGPGPLEQFRARLILEPELAAEAALRVGAEEIRELERLLQKIRENIAADERVSDSHFEFHERIAFASGNSILANVVHDLLWRNRTQEVWRTVRTRVDSAENLGKGVKFRAALIKKLRARDGRAARSLMNRHLKRIGEIYFGSHFHQVDPPADIPSENQIIQDRQKSPPA